MASGSKTVQNQHIPCLCFPEERGISAGPHSSELRPAAEASGQPQTSGRGESSALSPADGSASQAFQQPGSQQKVKRPGTGERRAAAVRAFRALLLSCSPKGHEHHPDAGPTCPVAGNTKEAHSSPSCCGQRPPKSCGGGTLPSGRLLGEGQWEEGGPSLSRTGPRAPGALCVPAHPRVTGL